MEIWIIEVLIKGGSDGGAGGAWTPPLFEALSKNSMLLEIMHGDCGFQLFTKAIVTNTRWLINCDYLGLQKSTMWVQKVPDF